MISTIAQDTPQNTQTWLYSSVQSFFTTCNWENQTLPTKSEVQRLEQAAAVELFTELSFELRVQQFFAAVNWEGISLSAAGTVHPTIENVEPLPEPTDGFTLTDFSDLF
ncbi:MAG TPA: hypothetical protein VL134_10920 [Leptolyngbya sp.]|jgi:hypothetical protein|nr:hypothetical protein [Leptolyngbya sp.]